MINPMFGMPQGAEWLIILAIVVLVFGAAKLPELARGTGQALRIFKTETKGLKDDDEKDKQDKQDKQDPPTAVAPAELPPTSSAQAEPTFQSDVEPEIRTDKHPG